MSRDVGLSHTREPLKPHWKATVFQDLEEPGLYVWTVEFHDRELDFIVDREFHDGRQHTPSSQPRDCCSPSPGGPIPSSPDSQSTLQMMGRDGRQEKPTSPDHKGRK